MPHFIIDCTENILRLKTPEEIMETVFEAATASNLFDAEDIKIRINPYQHYTVGNQKKDFIHIFSYIMEGRTTAQKSSLSHAIVSSLNTIFPEVPVISINIKDFEKATYCNKSMV
ncbi:5-carboxymethyl-2-hydroxymuconate Delta-isomerase [Flavobacterium sedimenticola]|uniref:5-carboxymethyl-2-hydroxymuconate Delta-isomerase n=1 Tax=Flavobacterium sedimenticola TaxID=3043286 RepID=A0ABT6XNX9_9FLAO|nr:5-carboxymethyl-2-hydroxymuconate Delta-isomerase [Flavobacterium sedimenticola]MDI9256791.1 5-carboxymethyl-2-hydroxymuconate Delta-isomerase [Flavobacterium sedimenticola]